MAFFDKSSFDGKKILPVAAKAYSLDYSQPHAYLIALTYITSGVDLLSRFTMPLGTKLGIFVDSVSGYEFGKNYRQKPLWSFVGGADSMIIPEPPEIPETILLADGYFVPSPTNVFEQVANSDSIEYSWAQKQTDETQTSDTTSSTKGSYHIDEVNTPDSTESDKGTPQQENIALSDDRTRWYSLLENCYWDYNPNHVYPDWIESRWDWMVWASDE